MNENTENITLEPVAPPADRVTSTADPTPFRCPKCPKSFLTKSGLNMHDMRVHTKKLGTGYNWKAKRKTIYPSDSLAVRRRKYHEMRDRYRKQGLSAKGLPFKTAWGKRTSEAMSKAAAKRQRRQTNPRSLANLRAKTWTPERRANFSRTMRRKAREKRMALAGRQMFEAGGKPPKKRIQYVYPTPDTPADTVTTTVVTTASIAAIRFCPHCGSNIEKHLL